MREKMFFIYSHCRLEANDPRIWFPNPMNYDKEELPWHVHQTLELLQDKFRIVFITSNPAFQKKWLDKYHIEHFIKRENTGYDFMNWKKGLEYMYSKGYFGKLILTNCSMFYQPQYLDTLDKYLAKNIDYIGTSMFPQNGPNAPFVQSQFLIVSERLVKSYIWKHFWDNFVKNTDDKDYVIWSNEMQFFYAIRKLNFSYAAINDVVWANWNCPDYLNKPNPLLKIRDNEILYLVNKLNYYGH